MNATLPPLDRSALEKAKVVSIVAMIFIHCLLFFSLYNDLAPLPSASSLKNKFIICLSFFGLCLPALAGAELRMRIQPFLEN
ncbi:MAG: hypothetical protein KDD33_13225, partial [Bdellovibrionales bacterium]|nr:hypothetical protein [Bdellovibrionales bacterium]